MKPLASSPVFLNMIEKVSDVPILGICVGTLMTLVVQSSSATIAVLQNFAAQAGPDGMTSIMGLAGAIPILLGDNIGTTITALLASIGQSKDAKRTAAAHCIFNISGSLVFIWFVKPYAALIQQISPKGPEVEVISRQIANAHTGFNLCMTIVWTLLLGVMVKLVSKVVKEMIQNVSVAAKSEDKTVLTGVQEKAEIVSNLSEKITDYLAELFSGGVLTEDQATQTARIMYALSDIERIAGLCKDIADSIMDKINKKYAFTAEAMNELAQSLQVIEKMYSDTLQVMENGEQEKAEEILKQKEKVMALDIDMRKAHMHRVATGKCSGNLTAPFSKILLAIDRIGNTCVNITETISSQVNFHYFMIEEKEKQA